MDLRPYLQFNRKFSNTLSRWLAAWGVHPAWITLSGVAVAAMGAWFMTEGTRTAMLSGALFFHLAFILDNCDGEVARINNQESASGQWLDMGCDVIVDILLWCGVYAGAWAFGIPLVSGWLWAAIAGSILNFGISAWERTAGCSSSIHADKSTVKEVRKKSTFFSLLDTLEHNGDVIVLIWIGALAGNPVFFTVCAAVYINLLWSVRFVVNYRRLVTGSSPVLVQRVWQGAMFALGIWVLVLTIQTISWKELAGMFERGGLLFLVVFLVFPLGTFFHALGFWALFPQPTRAKMDWMKLYWSKLTGESINKVTPFVDVGGEPAKVVLLVKNGLASMEEAVAAVGLFRVSFVVSEIFFILIGAALLSLFYPSQEVAIFAGLAVLFSIVFIFIIIASFRQLSRVAMKLLNCGDEAEPRIRARMMEVLWPPKRDFWISIFWNQIGWATFFLEVQLAFWAFGKPIGLVEAFAIQALLQAVTTLTFFVPASIGTQEAGLAFLLSKVHFSPAHGVALSIIKRARQYFWALIALVLYRLLTPKSSGRKNV